jgi:bacteriocin biosynthesis cyclodehydratase domain-containing protein
MEKTLPPLTAIECVWFATKDGLQIRTSRRAISLRGKAAVDVVPLLLRAFAHPRSAASVLEEMSGRVPPARLQPVVDALEQKGVLVRVEGAGAESTPAVDLERYRSMSQLFREEWRSDREAIERLRSRNLLVVLAPECPVSPLLGSLARAGVGRISAVLAGTDAEPATDLPRSELDLLMTEVLTWHPPLAGDQGLDQLVTGRDLVAFVGLGPALLHPRALRLQEACIRHRVPLIPLGLVDEGAVQLGPTYVPDETACLYCAEQQLTRALALVGGGRVMRDWNLGAGGRPRSSASRAGLGMFALEILRGLSGLRSPISAGVVVNLDFSAMETENQAVLRFPRCQHCGPARDLPKMRLWG